MNSARKGRDQEVIVMPEQRPADEEEIKRAEREDQTDKPEQREAPEDEIKKAEREAFERRSRGATEEEIREVETTTLFQRHAPEDELRRAEAVSEQRPADEEEIKK